ncbi:AraC family transcriptional regulator [Actinosynnema sp. NPDC020468]|uniref:AraC family transcriptional regulator n=1 Tax=Actinosynnema sp. NPDC020468 TaxID=3154488 RepID=UPI00340F5411
MDALAALLDGPRARQAFVLRTLLDPPWSLLIRDGAPLAVVALVRGNGWLVPSDAPPIALAAGDVAVVRGPEPYLLADSPDRPPQAVVHPGEVSTDAHGAPLCDVWNLGVRTWGTRADASVVLLSGTYSMDGEVSRRLLSVLPRVAVSATETALVSLLSAEVSRDAPGQSAVLDRLLDLLLISVLRAHLTRDDAPPWYRAHADPVVGHALRLLHNSPAAPWTVASLAAACSVSRAALARRFTALVGEPPMTYLTSWRLDLAADLLRDPATTLAAVAKAVGYSTPFALSTAFKRERGLSPTAHRTP